MDKKTITLTSEEWERIVELLNDSRSHPDKVYLLQKIHNQLYFTSAEEQPKGKAK